MDFGVLDCFLVYYYHPQKQYAVCVLLFFRVIGWGGFARMGCEVARPSYPIKKTPRVKRLYIYKKTSLFSQSIIYYAKCFFLILLGSGKHVVDFFLCFCSEGFVFK